MLQVFWDLGTGYTALLFSMIYLGYGVLQAILDPLRHIPGPLIARFTRLWYVWQIYKGRVHYTNIDLHKKYGPIVRLAPKFYSIDDVEAAKTVYGNGTRFVKVKATNMKARSKADLYSSHHGTWSGWCQRPKTTPERPIYLEIKIQFIMPYSAASIHQHML